MHRNFSRAITLSLLLVWWWHFYPYDDPCDKPMTGLWLVTAVKAAQSSSSSSSLPRRKKRQFLWFSDIHLDPYYGTDQAVQEEFNSNNNYGTVDCRSSNATITHPYGDFGCDSPPALVEALLQRASTYAYSGSHGGDDSNSNNSTAIDFVIITGDFVRHHNDILQPSPMDATEAILRNISESLNRHFPKETTTSSCPILPSLGNNDVTPDYYLDVQDPHELLGMVSRGLESLFENTESSSSNINGGAAAAAAGAGAAAYQSFAGGGYFAHYFESPLNLTVLSLNTIIYATKHIPSIQSSEQNDPLGQFAWLEQELQQAVRDERSVYIIGHLPPTIGSYQHTQLWQDSYLEQYYGIVDAYKVVKAQLFGHIHTDEFRIHKGVFPLYLTSSFTPIYGSNPSFRIVTYDADTLELLDYATEYLDLASARTAHKQHQQESTNPGNSTNTTISVSSLEVHWNRGEPFTEAYHVPDMSLKSLETVVYDLQTSTDSSVYWEALLSRLHVYTHGAEVCNRICRREWACTLTSTTANQYQSCLKKAFLEGDPFAISGIVLVSLISVFVTGYIACRCISRCHCPSRHSYTRPACRTDHPHNGEEVCEQHLPELS